MTSTLNESNEQFIERMKAQGTAHVGGLDFDHLIALAESFVAIEKHDLDVFSYTDKWEVQDGESGHGASNNADLSTAIRQCVEIIEGEQG